MNPRIGKAREPPCWKNGLRKTAIHAVVFVMCLSLRSNLGVVSASPQEIGNDPAVGESGASNYVPLEGNQEHINEVIVGYKPGFLKEATNWIGANHGRIKRVSEKLNYALVEVYGDIGDFIRKGGDQAFLRYLEENGRVELASHYPNDPFFFAPQWSPVQIYAPDAWEITKGSHDVIIAILDTGIDYNHPDLVDNMWVNDDEIPENGVDDDGNDYIDDYLGWNFAYDDPDDPTRPYRPTDPMDDDLGFGHGTHVAGIAAAVIDNNIGVSGTSNSKIMNLKVLVGSTGEGYNEDVAEAIEYATDNGANVVSMSFVHTSYSQAEKDAVVYAWQNGVLLVAGIGNSGTPKVYYPAAHSEVIAVGAVDYDDTRAGFSTYGSHLDLMAPGVEILSTAPSNILPQPDVIELDGAFYRFISGTSQATPYVSGVAALVWSEMSSPTNQQVKDILRTTAYDIIYSAGGEQATPGWDEYTGWGKVHAHGAVLAAYGGPSLEIESFKIEEGRDYTNTVDVTLDVLAKNSDDGFQLMRFSNDGIWDGNPPEELNWVPYSSHYTQWSLESVSGDGVRTVYIQVMDFSSNTADASDAINLDRTPPSALVDSLPQYVNSPSFDVSWSGEDPDPGIGLKSYEIQSMDGLAGDFEDWQIGGDFEYHNSGAWNFLHDIDFAPDGSYALAVGASGQVFSYSGGTFTQIPSGITVSLYTVSFKPDGSEALMAGFGEVWKYVPSMGTFSMLLSVPGMHFFEIDWKPDGSEALLVGGNPTYGFVYEYSGGFFTLLRNEGPILRGVDYLPEPNDSMQALIVGEDEIILKYYSGNFLRQPPAWRAWGYIDIRLHDVEFSPDGSIALIVADDGYVYEFENGGLSIRLDTGLDQHLYGVDFRSDGQEALISSGNGKAVLYSDGNYLVVIYSMGGLEMASVSYQPANGYEAVMVGRSTESWSYYSLVTKTSEVFDGEEGHTYCFRARAQDYLGNWGLWGVPYDTCTIVNGAAPISDLQAELSPSTAPGTFDDYVSDEDLNEGTPVIGDITRLQLNDGQRYEIMEADVGGYNSLEVIFYIPLSHAGNHAGTSYGLYLNADVNPQYDDTFQFLYYHPQTETWIPMFIIDENENYQTRIYPLGTDTFGHRYYAKIKIVDTNDLDSGTGNQDVLCLDRLQIKTTLPIGSLRDIILTWELSPDDAIDIDEYDIYRSDQIDGTYTYVGSVSQGTSDWTDEDAAVDDSNYFYTVVARDLTGLTGVDPKERATKFIVPLGHPIYLFSIPVTPRDTSVEAVLASIDGHWDCVHWFDPTLLPGDPWRKRCSWQSQGDLTEITEHMGLWITLSQYQYGLVVAGRVPSETQIPLYQDTTNYVGYPSFEERTVADALEGITYTAIGGFDETNPPTYLKELAADDILCAGNGYVIATPPARWGCRCG